MKNPSFITFEAATVFGLLLISCNPIGAPLPGDATDTPAIQHVAYTGEFTYTVDPGVTAKDVYFVFTNSSMTQNAQQKPSVDGQTITVDGVSLPAPGPQPLYSLDSSPQTTIRWIAESNRLLPGLLKPAGSKRVGSANTIGSGAPSLDTAGNAGSFNDFDASGDLVPVNATCRYVSPAPIAVPDGTTRTLNVWAANDCWTSTGTTGTTGNEKRHLIDQTMVDALADTFLKAEVGNDIYDWVTAILGAEWGTNAYNELIAPNNEITIFLADIEADNSDTGGIVGYFWAGNNFTVASNSVPGTNQRIMFVIDAVMYANPSADGSMGLGTTGWAKTTFWPEEIFSTLAHEFQHMIEFFQKTVTRAGGTGADTWINEMCSMITEDLVADKLGVEGPRGVANADGTAGSAGNTHGRFPDFNQYSYFPLAVTSDYGLTDYSVSYAFGSWLARNYGGAELLRRIVQCSQTDQTAVINAAEAASGRQDESMTRLLSKWSAAVLVSDTTSAPAGYRYNTGGWATSGAGGESYNLGSINIFNYAPSLNVFTATGTVPPSTFNRSSNVYFRAAQGLDSAKTWTIDLPENIAMSVVVK